MGKAMKHFCETKIKDAGGHAVFKYEGKRVSPSDTPNSLGIGEALREAIEDGDNAEDFSVQIDVFL